MCIFFSVCSKGDGKLLYFNAKQRAELRKNNPKNYDPDSHTSIADFYGYTGAKEDDLNKYAYRPLDQKFIIDQINTIDDSKMIEEKIKQIDLSLVIPELIIKPIIHPFRVKRSNP